MSFNLKPLFIHLLNGVMPPACLSCGDDVDRQGNICGSCWAKINFISDPLCETCGHPFQYEMPGEISCANCLKTHPQYDMARAAFHYDDNSRPLITGYKFSDKTHATKAFARLMITAGRPFLGKVDFVAPIPLHYFRLLSRKYNQAALLSKEIATMTNTPLLPDLLLKIKNTPPQSSLSGHARRKNVKSAFKFNEKYSKEVIGKSIMLIDDVLTTGSTVNACSKLLKKAGAASVKVLTLARTVI